MNAWIIYNGALKYNKIETLVDKLVLEGEILGITLHKVRNNEIIPLLAPEKKIILIKNLPDPKFIIFWDKDIKLARHLEDLGYHVYNNSTSIELCDNKGLMHQNLEGLPMPKTILSPKTYYTQTFSLEYMDYINKYIKFPCIIKECFGSFGMQVYLANNENEFKNTIEKIGSKDFLIQEYIKESCGTDIRINIIGNKVIGAMKRENKNDFRANITIGGTATPYVLSEAEKNLALLAHKKLNLHFSGVDILFGNSGPILCEVNSNVNFLSFDNTFKCNFGKEILKYIIEIEKN